MNNTSVKKNFILNVILTMSSVIFPFVTFKYVSNILLPTGTGRITFATSVISYFLMFAQLGIPTYGVRICAQVRDNRLELTKTVHELLFINLITTFLSYFVLVISIILIPRFFEERVLLLIISISIFLGTLGIEWLYKALEQYKYITVRSVIFKFIALIAIFFLVKKEEDYLIYGAITIFASSASNILNLINAHKYIGFKPIGNYNLKRHIKPVLVFFTMACAATIYTNLDNVMLGFMTSNTDVGYYGAAVKIKNILVSIVTSLGAVMLPTASFFIQHKDLDSFHRICRKAIHFVIVISVPMTIYFIIFARYGILFLSGEEYANSVIPMQIIMPTLVFIGLSNILGIQILVPTGREKFVLYSELAGALVDLLLNALLIPMYASSGAAIGTLVAELIVLIIQLAFLKKEVISYFLSIKYFDIVFGVVLASLASIWIIFLGLNNFFTLIISAVVFFGVYCLILLIRKEETMIEIFHFVFSKFNKKK